MPYTRKDELLKEPPSRPEIKRSKEKLQDVADEAGLYISLTSNLGWKRLVRDYIEPRTSMDRILVATADKLVDERAGVKELVNLLNFINEKVKEGTRAFEELKSE